MGGRIGWGGGDVQVAGGDVHFTDYVFFVDVGLLLLAGIVMEVASSRRRRRQARLWQQRQAEMQDFEGRLDEALERMDRIDEMARR